MYRIWQLMTQDRDFQVYVFFGQTADVNQLQNGGENGERAN
jgi:hypothetical protein